jgi:dephospho-CoA kinase
LGVSLALPSEPLRIGLTGGIGSGKSTVAQMLVDLGATLIDTDALAKALTSPGGAAVDAIRHAFGPEFIDESGGLARERMRELVFADDVARLRLESLLHPLINAQAQRLAQASGSSVLVFDVPLLVESGHWRSKVHLVVVVDCDEMTQVKRVIGRSGWTEHAVKAVMARQATREARRACADAVILNDGISLPELRDKVGSLWSEWVSGSCAKRL